MNTSRLGRLLLAPILLASFCATAFGGDAIESVSGTYKDALRKAGEAGKPLLIEFWSNSHQDCKRQEQQMEEIPEMMKKFLLYRINGDQNQSLVKQFNVSIFPTLVFLKPNGTEVYRQQTIFGEAYQLKNELEKVLDKAGPIPKSQKQREPPSDKTPAGAVQRAAYEKAASNELKAAMNQLNVGRKADAIKAFKHVVSHYSGSEAASQAQEKLDELEPEKKEK